MNTLLETVARHLPGGPSGLTELRHEEDFIKIDPECVDTPEFYGGGANIPSVYNNSFARSEVQGVYSTRGDIFRVKSEGKGCF